MRNLFCIILLCCSPAIKSSAQGSGFYLDGYIIQKTDTTICRIWFNPASPAYIDEMTVWLNDTSQTISFEKDKSLVGFGFTQQGYRAHYGRIRLQGLNSWVYAFAKKLVTGTLELYELPYGLLKKDPESLGLKREFFSAYYINRTDHESPSLPTLLKSMKKKEILGFIKDFPNLKDIPSVFTPQELLDLVKQYNAWNESQ